MPTKRVMNGQTALHVQIDGPQDADAPTLVFGNSLGSNLHLWDAVIEHLPADLRIIRYDMRGHGRSDVPDGPYTMGALIKDAEAVCDAAKVRDCMFVGLSVGGLVAQGLAVKRPDQVRAIVLSNTAAKIGNAKMWDDRIAAVKNDGLAMMADGIMQRWFGRDFYATPAMVPWRDMLVATSATGYIGTCAAIAGTDFYTPTSGLRLPTLGIAGSEDKTTPPDMVRETTDLVPGSQFALMRRVGHLPCVDNPAGYAQILNDFMTRTGHMIRDDSY
ncbi:3-oxoadipate enol-lactonase [Yoonia sp. 208BN28-4]|uniref:3-oxoadipate enol-lactonase n=1 Tax=Yoonia sp. 208BN28-4 TaxID=3126505 RepID=UPI0030AD5AA7